MAAAFFQKGMQSRRRIFSGERLPLWVFKPAGFDDLQSAKRLIRGGNADIFAQANPICRKYLPCAFACGREAASESRWRGAKWKIVALRLAGKGPASSPAQDIGTV